MPPLEPAPARPECRPGRRRTIEELPGKATDAIVVPDQHVPAAELAGEVVPAVDVPGFTLPGQELDAGCIVRFDAPGGCLGAYEISSVAIPEVRVPGFTIDPVVVDGERVADAIVRPPLIVPEVAVPAVRVEQNCAIEETADGRLALVRRRLVRPAAVRRESVRPGAHREPVCVDDDCSAEVIVDEVVVPQAGLAEIVIPERTVILGRISDTPQTLAVDTEAGRSYFAPVDLLFAIDSAQLGPDAAPVLQAIAAELNETAPGSRITVEGHTDSDGPRAYNDDLSRRRADAVRDWLVGVGGVSADRITTAGFGEDVPVASNETAEGRALNRRVVISVEV